MGSSNAEHRTGSPASRWQPPSAKAGPGDRTASLPEGRATSVPEASSESLAKSCARASK
ncbi:MAG: hypothetical protein ABSB49_14470 [Polyangia bacterium]